MGTIPVCKSALCCLSDVYARRFFISLHVFECDLWSLGLVAEQPQGLTSRFEICPCASAVQRPTAGQGWGPRHSQCPKEVNPAGFRSRSGWCWGRIPQCRDRRDRRSPSLPARLPRQLSCHRGTAGRGARPRAVPVWHPAHPGHPSQAANPCCSLSAWGFGNQSRWPLWQSRGGEGARMKA